MSYPLYAAEWQLTPAVTTSIFAVYPSLVVGTLIRFGDISDYIGRRLAMLLGLAASLIGVLLFAAAPTVHWIFIGRAFMGIAYFLQGAVALLLGVAATVWGLRMGTDLGCAAIAFLGITALLLAAFTRWSRPF